MRRKGEDHSTFDEQKAVEGLRKRLAELHEQRSSPSHAYWSGLLVRTNRRIDEATSAKALSISWAARVAIPGVVAIVFFFIGLHYYAPDLRRDEASVSTIIEMLPEDAVDSILIQPGEIGTPLSAIGTEIFEFSTDQISDYLLATGNARIAVSTLSDADVSDLLSALKARKNL
jgi:hypothetical protein